MPGLRRSAPTASKRERRLLVPGRCASRCAAALVAVLAPSACAASAPPATGPGTPVTVMTRNLYLGGDIDGPVTALRTTSGDLPQLLALATANARLRATVDATDFASRSTALAGEIAAQRPDLVGLQEVALWRSGPLRLPPPLGTGSLGRTDAEQVDVDFLAVLLDRLRQAGAPYEAVSVQPESDVEGPAFDGVQGIGSRRDVRLTVRDVVLRRAGSGVEVERATSGRYAASVPVQAGPVQYRFLRGWNAVDVRVGGRRLRFLNTHLESESHATAAAQARELLAGPAAVTDRPVVLACDCNTDPDDGSPDASGTPRDAPYRVLAGAGLVDTWLRTATSRQGATSGLSETLRDPPDQAAAGWRRRIDLVLARAAGGAAVTVERAAVVGRDPAGRTPSGLWPSDHAGLAVRLRA